MSDRPQHESTLVGAVHPLLPQAVALHHSGRLDEAANIYTQILSQSPQDFDATHLLGVVALQQGRFDDAKRLINAAVAVNPHDAAAVGNLGTSYMRDGQLEAAFQWFEIALKLQPDSSVALTNAATALHNMGRYRDAIPLLRKANAGDSNALVCNLLGGCLIKSGEPREAAEFFEAATRAQPDDAEGWANLSVALNAIGQTARAHECADKAVSLKPQSSVALGALAAAQFDQGRLADAIESYRQGVSLPGPSAQMLAAYGNVLVSSGLNEEAIEQLQRALRLDDKNLNLRWAIVVARLKSIYSSKSEIAASRSAFAKSLEEIAAWYEGTDGVFEPFNAVGVIQPFFIAYQPFNNRDLLARYGALCATWMATLPIEASDPAARASVETAAPAGRRKLRIGIVSAHISDSSVWNAITKGWVYQIDQTKFEIHLLQLSRTGDEETENARRRVAYFDDKPTSVSAWAQTILGKELDVLIYPEIGMDPLTLQLASLRLAPVQAATWGHPETTGLPTMDLYISADALEPPHAADNYSERLLRLPNLGVYVEPLTPAILKPDLRSLKLPSNQPLLLCPGAPFKYSPLYDEVWVEIAKRLQKRFFKRSSGGRLVFFGSRSATMDRLLANRLRAAFERAELEFDAHVSIIPNLDRPRFFGLMRQSALMLDTVGFSGFNTALQAIECDLPVLAFEGEFMRGRLASAIMRRLELPELVATTTADFIDKAVALAGDAGRRQRIREEIFERRKVLFHDMAPVRALESYLTDAVKSTRSG
jgi:protein O-GlcNAc transferase